MSEQERERERLKVYVCVREREGIIAIKYILFDFTISNLPLLTNSVYFSRSVIVKPIARTPRQPTTSAESAVLSTLSVIFYILVNLKESLSFVRSWYLPSPVSVYIH